MSEPGTWGQAVEWACSPDWRLRQGAGRWLSRDGNLAEARPLVWKLLLDADNVAVTQDVAETLLARQDLEGLALVLEATNAADDQQLDYLHAAVAEAYMDEAMRAVEPGLSARLRALVRTAPPSVANAASRVLSELSPD